MDTVSDYQSGILCEQGFMKESFDSQGELRKNFTIKGIQKVKDILKEDKYKKEFAQILIKETKGLSQEDKFGVICELRQMLI